MPRPRKTVVIGLLGTQLDRSALPNRRPIPDRWDRWRPTLSLCQHEDFLPDRIELLAEPKFRPSAKVLVDDIEACSPETEVALHDVHFRDPWDFAETYAVLRDFADSYSFDEDENEYYVHITTGTHVAQICLFLLVENRHLPARLIQTSPPRARRKKGGQAIGQYTIIDLDLSRYDQLAARFQAERDTGTSFLKAGIETRSETFNALIERIEVVATHSPAPILLTGATGVGKTQLARRIFELKRTATTDGRCRGAFVEVNCATLRGDGAMSALFGHEKGAFTGALARREGLLKSADQGLLFLDEIGELGLDEQAMLLRAIEEGVFLPMGADRPQESRFQLIAGTNRDLYGEVRAGRFREDLLARIDLWAFELPGLSERIQDIEPNLDYELAKHASESRRVSFNREARRAFLEFAESPDSPWHANFRDLGAAVTRLATLAGNGRITKALVQAEVDRLRAGWSRLAGTGSSRTGPSDDALLADALGDRSGELDLFDRVQLAEVLRVCRSSPSLAAAGRRLFAESRKQKASRNDSDRLKKYLARFGLDWRGLGSGDRA